MSIQISITAPASNTARLRRNVGIAVVSLFALAATGGHRRPPAATSRRPRCTSPRDGCRR
jgi:hypothetical protein